MKWLQWISIFYQPSRRHAQNNTSNNMREHVKPVKVWDKRKMLWVKVHKQLTVVVYLFSYSNRLTELTVTQVLNSTYLPTVAVSNHGRKTEEQHEEWILNHIFTIFIICKVKIHIALGGEIMLTQRTELPLCGIRPSIMHILPHTLFSLDYLISICAPFISVSLPPYMLLHLCTSLLLTHMISMVTFFGCRRQYSQYTYTVIFCLCLSREHIICAQMGIQRQKHIS